ncbi:peptidyl-prolyl cis-trans isomerase [Litchfieldia salsa]|uniref:peptidylprolyl isomerase n=1 Tax=Litchfieldia salsa TaxID=930152 RepID=A0A1H0WYX2_9BACI|nr:peptidyl-prolyl cis-trans isomerase [Litchfieldia salsa]SDP95944.1 foldase protein PrsA [Litchfieldia salsa]
MNTKILWGIIGFLVLLNCLTVAYFFSNNQGGFKKVSTSVDINSSTEETVGKIGNTVITRQEWLVELEKRYGKETLEDMIDEKVIKEMASKYKIDISEDVIEREVTMIKTMYNPLDHEKINDDQWREQIEMSLLLEELVTKDAVISEEELQQFYDQNKDLYDIPTTYHLSHIVVKNVEEANQVVKELDNGSNFSALAMEKSIDEFSASQGGELGFVSEESGFVPEGYIEKAKQMDLNQWSEPIELEEGYAVIHLHEVIPGVTYSFDEVKNQIRRQIAIDQVQGALSIKSFWEEAEVSWFYENE